MLRHNHFITVRLLAAAILLAVVGAQAQTQSAGTDREKVQLQPLEFSVQPGEMVGHEQVIRQFIKSGTNQFMFVMPPGVRCESTTAGTLGLSSPDGQYHLELRILAPGAEEGTLKRIQALKQKTLESCAKARNVEEFNTSVAGWRAEGLQLRESLPVFGERLFRFVWVPCTAGILEFALSSSAERATAAVQTMDSLLITLRSNEKGKLEIVRRSEKS
jgi:hypothetical protein